jgi:hypothetical protein
MYKALILQKVVDIGQQPTFKLNVQNEMQLPIDLIAMFRTFSREQTSNVTFSDWSLHVSTPLEV